MTSKYCSMKGGCMICDRLFCDGKGGAGGGLDLVGYRSRSSVLHTGDAVRPGMRERSVSSGRGGGTAAAGAAGGETPEGGDKEKEEG